MLNSSFLRKLYLGNRSDFESVSKEKRAILTSQLSIICIILSLFYLIFDAILGSTSSVFIYFILGAIGLASLLVNLSSKTILAKMILMIGSNIVVFIFFEREYQGTGSYMFFICCILGGFALFGYEGKKYAISLSALSLLLFLISYNYTLSFLSKTDFTAAEAGINFAINFSIASATAILIIIFLLDLNENSEASLLETTKALEENKKRFELAIKGSSVGVWDWDILKQELYMSYHLTQMLGYPKENYEHITTESIDNMMHADDVDHFKQELKKHFTKRTPFRVECRMKRVDGSYVWVLDTGQAQWNEKGKPQRMLGTIVNINELKNAFRELKEKNTLLEKTNEELDRFVYSASHDLKAPLSSIQGLVNVASQLKEADEIGECIKMIENRVITLNGFIAEIIDYSRNSRLEVAKEEIKLRELVCELIEGLQFFEKSEDIQFDIQITEDIKITTDKGRLKIILNNLLVNAIKYHDWNKKDQFIKISTAKAAEHLIVKIEDNGLGIAKDYQDKIFDMFFRASEKSEGSGLGLYITKEMIAKIGGTISLYSERGTGSSFSINLPVSGSIKS